MGENYAKGDSKERVVPRGHRARAWMTGILLALAVFLLWKVPNVLFLFFGCTLLALFLTSLSNFLSKLTNLSHAWSLSIVVLSLLLLLAGLGFLIAPKIAQQGSKLSKELPRAAHQLEETLKQQEWSRGLVNSLKLGAQQGNKIAGQAFGVLSSTISVIGGLLVLIFVGFYLASSPKLYLDGILKLFPKRKRERMHEVATAEASTLQRWILGRLLLMIVNGIVTAITLAIMGVPLALTLGIISAILNFIPNIGPLLATVPAVLMGYLEGPDKALQVLVFYFVYQMLDGYVLTPLVEKRTVALPPAVTIMVQVLFGLVWGPLGVLFAAPITAAAMVAVKMLYQEDVLGDRVKLPAS